MSIPSTLGNFKLEKDGSQVTITISSFVQITGAMYVYTNTPVVEDIDISTQATIPYHQTLVQDTYPYYNFEKLLSFSEKPLKEAVIELDKRVTSLEANGGGASGGGQYLVNVRVGDNLRGQTIFFNQELMPTIGYAYEDIRQAGGFGYLHAGEMHAT